MYILLLENSTLTVELLYHIVRSIHETRYACIVGQLGCKMYVDVIKCKLIKSYQMYKNDTSNTDHDLPARRAGISEDSPADHVTDHTREYTKRILLVANLLS